jgi:hypothetical protein
MVLGYDYSKQKRRWWQTNAPHPPAVLMATVVRRSNTDSIAQCGMSTATLEATGHRQSGNYVLRIAPVAARATGIQTTINKYTCKAGHFDGHGNALVSNRVHRPM